MEKCDRIGVMIRCGNLVITPCPVLVFAAPERDFYLLIDLGKVGRHFQYLNVIGFRESSINRKFFVVGRKCFLVVYHFLNLCSQNFGGRLLYAVSSIYSERFNSCAEIGERNTFFIIFYEINSFDPIGIGCHMFSSLCLG